MRKMRIGRLLSGVAMAVALTTGTAGLAMAEDKTEAPAAEARPFDPASVDSFSGAFLGAFTADVNGDYQMAVDLYRTAMLFEPDNISVQERLLINLLLNGNFDEAVLEARELKDDTNVDRITSLVLGLDAIRDGDSEAAISFFSQQTNNDLDLLMNGLLTGWAQFDKGSLKEALKTVEGLKGPDWFGIFKNYTAGAMALAGGDDDAARGYFRSVLSDRVGGATAQDLYLRSVIALAGLEARSGEKQRALDVFAASEDVAGRSAVLDNVREAIEAGNLPKQEVASATDGAASVLFGIGAALNQSTGGRGATDEIVAIYLHAAHKLDSDATDAIFVLGNIADGAEKPEKAIEYYKQIGEDSPYKKISELQLGLDLAQIGKMDEARERLKGLIALDPSDFRAYLAYGSVLSEEKDYRAMADNFDAAVKAIGPDPQREHWGVFYQRGIAYERLKEWDKAEPNFREALKLFPDQPQVLNYLGYSWIDKNMNLKEGMDMIAKAAELRPNDGYIIDSLGWAHYRLGEYEEAVKSLERAVSLKEDDSTINDHLGDAYWQVGRKLEATFQWRRALEASKTEEHTEVDPAEIERKLKEGLDSKQKAVEVASSDDNFTEPAQTPSETKQVQATAETAQAEAPAEGDQTEAPANADQAQAPPETKAQPQAQEPDGQVPEKTAYKVRLGESLWKIAEDALGGGMRFHEIIRLNPQLKTNPNLIFPGQEIKLPAPGAGDGIAK
ncbi:tetratricopeptide repeat protein [Rhizobium sp. L1K21]|uniref:tetratricopeptide repeat protein n=1 Tax=Rhizobium sp. L1K21 TaxID=2954933 RepID=UPI002092C52D|nr:tetratricopeptide repeat protein [Rhizobium sp. L1K21]MCO6186925.1 tetratricopeptide repeat protein [Rhizobium sp. L1K21]